MTKRKIALLGSIDGEDHFKPADAVAPFADSARTLALHQEFMGRPATRIYADDKTVVKLRIELHLRMEQAHFWIKSTLAKEQKLNIHHPFKTWCVIYRGDWSDKAQSVVVGNVTPRLRPLHMILKESPSSEEQRSSHLSLFSRVFELYFETAKKHAIKLDEGLSNFAIDAKGDVYYVDDETYHWDNFISFSTMLAVYIRTFDWFDADFIEQLAAELIDRLDQVFDDINCRANISYQLRSAFMPDGHKQNMCFLLSDLLIRRPGEAVPKYQAPTNINTQGSAHSKPEYYATESSQQLDDVTAKKIASEQEQATDVAADQGVEGERYIAVLADIHANYPALEAVMNYLEKEGVTTGIVLGDIVGYGPDPSACVQRIKDSGFDVIKGNHDHGAALNNTKRGFSRNAKLVIDWTATVLSEEERDWLKYLPPIIETDEWLAVHGAPMDPSFFYGYVYLMTYVDNLDYMQNKNQTLCFHGHSHMPGVYARDQSGADHHIIQPRVSLNDYLHSLVCPGSIGQPRNGNIEAQFAIYDRQNREVIFKAVPYDVEQVIARMVEFDLPQALRERLAKGQ